MKMLLVLMIAVMSFGVCGELGKDDYIVKGDVEFDIQAQIKEFYKTKKLQVGNLQLKMKSSKKDKTYVMQTVTFDKIDKTKDFFVTVTFVATPGFGTSLGYRDITVVFTDIKEIKLVNVECYSRTGTSKEYTWKIYKKWKVSLVDGSFYFLEYPFDVYLLQYILDTKIKTQHPSICAAAKEAEEWLKNYQKSLEMDKLNKDKKKK